MHRFKIIIDRASERSERRSVIGRSMGRGLSDIQQIFPGYPLEVVS